MCFSVYVQPASTSSKIGFVRLPLDHSTVVFAASRPARPTRRRWRRLRARPCVRTSAGLLVHRHRRQRGVVTSSAGLLPARRPSPSSPAVVEAAEAAVSAGGAWSSNDNIVNIVAAAAANQPSAVLARRASLKPPTTPSKQGRRRIPCLPRSSHQMVARRDRLTIRPQ